MRSGTRCSLYIFHPLYIQDATNVWEDMLARNCPKFSVIQDAGYDNRIIKTSLLKNMPPQTTPGAKFILTSVRSPSSYSVLNSQCFKRFTLFMNNFIV